jgi:hypothetical protein
MRNGRGARGGAGTECSPRRLRAGCVVRLVITAGFVTWDQPLFNPVEWKMG